MEDESVPVEQEQPPEEAEEVEEGRVTGSRKQNSQSSKKNKVGKMVRLQVVCEAACEPLGTRLLYM